ncbi:MAG: hypothetical protein DI534_09710 [Leifsonia xyli]|nr:MAG: hypothetical protein DI534_09710 [Leifsonia xyli]
MTPNRIVAAAGAVVFGAVGAWGLVASLDPAVDQSAGSLLAGALSTNLALAGVHLSIGIVLAWGALRGRRLTRHLNVAVGALLLGLGLFGLFAVGTPANLPALNGFGNLLHFAASTVLLATGLGAPPTHADAKAAGANLQSDIS